MVDNENIRHRFSMRVESFRKGIMKLLYKHVQLAGYLLTRSYFMAHVVW